MFVHTLLESHGPLLKGLTKLIDENKPIITKHKYFTSPLAKCSVICRSKLGWKPKTLSLYPLQSHSDLLSKLQSGEELLRPLIHYPSKSFQVCFSGFLEVFSASLFVFCLVLFFVCLFIRVFLVGWCLVGFVCLFWFFVRFDLVLVSVV